MKKRTTKANIKSLGRNEIFVFGSNAQGAHGGGAAKLAHQKFGAKMGIARGITGKCYAIDTMSGMDVIIEQIEPFIVAAKAFPKKKFLVTELGCGIAGFTPEQIAPLFFAAKDVENIHLPESFWKIINAKQIVRGYKVFNSDMTCRDFKYAVGKEYKLKGALEICENGFHFCTIANHCFSYYSFNPDNAVCEVEALGNIQTHGNDSKVATDHIRIVRRLSWQEVLVLVNTGANNTGRSNSGDSNSGSCNSGSCNSGSRNIGDSNSGSRNIGDSNSGSRNSGEWNSGDRNSGDSNSGSWNSGSRNSGDSNSGYRSAGAFCTEENPIMVLFDKPCAKMRVKDWERHPAIDILRNVDPTMWVPDYAMSDEEKKNNPGWEALEGYLKTIPMKDAWKNMWGNLTYDKKKIITSLENFDAEKFKEITGITV